VLLKKGLFNLFQESLHLFLFGKKTEQ